MSHLPPELPPAHLRDPGDAWAVSPEGKKYWGRFGAAGLLVWHPTAGILLQHRAPWSHNGGTWALPGGARRLGETALEGALREAKEEAGVPAELVDVLFESVVDLGFWSYTTVVVRARENFEPVIGDTESIALAWVALDDVASYDLHPSFARAWPGLLLELVRR
jgi:8-oxo-dGTP diphosphatase